MSRPLEPWQVLKSRNVFHEPPWISISVHEVRLPDGKVVPDYYQVQMQEYVVVFAETGEGNVIVQRQYRHGVGKVSLVLPDAYIEGTDDPLTTARRALIEQTGYEAPEWQFLARLLPSDGYGCGMAYFYACRSARKVAEPHATESQDSELLLMPVGELWQALRRGDVAAFDSATAIGLAANLLPKLPAL